MMTCEEVVAAALSLPGSERERVLRAIAKSLDTEFIAEIRCRQQAFRDGEPGLPADDVFDELLEE